MARNSEPSVARRNMLRVIASGAIGGMPVMLTSGGLKAGTSAHACLYADAALARYGFPEGHPLGADRQAAFLKESERQGLLAKVRVCASRAATIEEIGRFHTRDHIDKVKHAERNELAFLDNGDTPVVPGVFETSSNVVGAVLDGLARVMRRECDRSFQPVGGLHHAGRDHSAGFCVFNDLGVVIETLRAQYGIRRVAYVDIDVHHGDGIYYAYEEDAELVFADIPEFIVFQCGADGLKDDPLAHLNYTPAVHAHATKSLRGIAERFSGGRLMAFGGGGHNRGNPAKAWSTVLREIG